MTDSNLSEVLALDRRLDLNAAAELQRALLAHDKPHLSLNAGAVSYLGALCLQLLLAAADDRRKRGASLALSPRSAAFDAALATFGVPLDRLQTGMTP
jgi:chemotaxis protein CheX